MINTVTLNPAIDKVLFLERFERNITNRVQRLRETIGGKGTHVSINLRLLGMNSRVFGICHGDTGSRITALLQRHQLDVRFLHKNGADSRTNYLLVEESGDCTVVAERGVQLREDDLEELFQHMEDSVGEKDYLVLSGDSSNCDPSVYKQLLKRLEHKRLKVFLDTSGEALADCLLAAPYLVKPNLDELSDLCGRKVSEEVGDVVEAIDSLGSFAATYIAVSMGAGGSIIKGPEGYFLARPPKARVVNTIGCGDCYLAGLIYGFASGLPIQEALQIATGASAATAESSSSVGFDAARAKELAALTQVTQLQYTK